MEPQNEWQYAEQGQKQPENPKILLGIGDRFLSKVTLRDLFAGLAMQAALSAYLMPNTPSIPDEVKVISREAYVLADEMLKAREVKCPTS